MRREHLAQLLRAPSHVIDRRDVLMVGSQSVLEPGTRIGGFGPGTPSFAELVDTALTDSLFRSWVDAASVAAKERIRRNAGSLSPTDRAATMTARYSLRSRNGAIR